MKKQLYVGYASLDVTPPLGVNLAGYYFDRIADGVLDPLEVVALAVRSGDKTALIVSIDTLGLAKIFTDKIIAEASRKTGVPEDAFFVHSTHTHLAPSVERTYKSEFENHLNDVYAEYLLFRTVDACVMAVEDLTPATLGIAKSKAEGVAFVRRFRMKDGSVRTNAGVNNPDILESIGTPDEEVSVVRFDREGKETVLLVNFANHPDVIYGWQVSADWPGLTRRYVEKSLDAKCIVVNGAQGDINHVNVNPSAAEWANFSPNDYSDTRPHYLHAKHIARVLTGAVLSVYEKAEYIEDYEINYKKKLVDIPANKPAPEDMPLARKYYELHMAGRDDEVPYPTDGMVRTTVIAEACRMVELEHAPDNFELPFTALKIGPVSLFGIPGEPFSAIGKGIKAGKGNKLVIPCCTVNDYAGYFPTQDAFDEGGYEARSSRFRAGVAEIIIDTGIEMLSEL